jgi:lipoprotein NlpI
VSLIAGRAARVEDTRVRSWLALIGTICLAAAVADTPPPTRTQPLLDLARDLEGERDAGSNVYYEEQLRRFRHELQRSRAPDDAECNRAMGAEKYAALHMNVAEWLEGLGDLPGAMVEYRSALACRPRDVRVHARMARASMHLREFAAARAHVEQGLIIDPRNIDLHRIAGHIDFIGERWADAMARFRYVASSESDVDEAASAQLMFWLTQLRAGITRPEFIARRAGEGWPQPLLRYMRGELTEADVASGLLEEESGELGEIDAQLAAALFYVGESRWARGEPDLARQYFAAVINIRLASYDEYRLALAEIAKLNERLASGSRLP